MRVTPFQFLVFKTCSLAKSSRWFACTFLLLIPCNLFATTCTTASSGPWSAAAVWISGIHPQNGDTVIISIGDSVLVDQSTPALAELLVNGLLALGADTLFVQAGANPGDTLVKVHGTLDAGSGWFSVMGPTRPIVHFATGSLFQTSARFPYASPSLFDSTASPLFALDSASTWEYYSENLDLIDVSYLLSNITGRAYQNLTLSSVVASFRANPLVIHGTLHIGFGATMKTYTPQTITLSGDVINDNQGESGSGGAGLHGCGMESLDNDTWIFDAGKDTSHWSGPSQLGTVIVRANTVLSVRFIDDTHCDSLDILSGLIEEGMPCGGHLVGRVYSEFPRTLDSLNPVDSFYGLGLTIQSGTNPYLGRTRVVRTSGYLPPNANPVDHPVLRYYSISPGDGPQQGAKNEMRVQFHCDEWNGAVASRLHFWRSRDRGNTWAFSGLTRFDASSNVFVWDTTVLGWPNDSGSYYWMLSEGYTDTPLPTELTSFSALPSGNGILLSWQTTSEINVAGYEIDRNSVGDSEVIASFETDDSLRARSQFGATYDYADSVAPLGEIRYTLYEITKDGIRLWLGSRVVTLAGPSDTPVLSDVRFERGALFLSLNAPQAVTITVSDAIGRIQLFRTFGSGSQSGLTVPLSLPAGLYFVIARWEGGETTQKFLVGQ